MVTACAHNLRLDLLELCILRLCTYVRMYNSENAVCVCVCVCVCACVCVCPIARAGSKPLMSHSYKLLLCPPHCAMPTTSIMHTSISLAGVCMHGVCGSGPHTLSFVWEWPHPLSFVWDVHSGEEGSEVSVVC